MITNTEEMPGFFERAYNGFISADAFAQIEFAITVGGLAITAIAAIKALNIAKKKSK